MKLISWNVNGLRACIQKGFLDFFHAQNADFFCLQETKLSEGQLSLDLPGYEQYWCYAHKKGYSGTAIFTKHTPLSVHYGLDVPELDTEGRLITLEYPEFFLVTCYTPNAQRELARIDHRMKWDEAFRTYLQKLDAQKPVIICGDLNVAHQEIDLKNPKSNRGSAGFSDEERNSFQQTLDCGYTDTFRHLHPDATGCYTWWSYMFKAREKNAGWRIDYFLVSDRVQNAVYHADIHSEVLGSDHCPVSIDIDLICNGGIWNPDPEGIPKVLRPDGTTATESKAYAPKAKAFATGAIALFLLVLILIGLSGENAEFPFPVITTPGPAAPQTNQTMKSAPISIDRPLWHLPSVSYKPNVESYNQFYLITSSDWAEYYISPIPAELTTQYCVQLCFPLTEYGKELDLGDNPLEIEFDPLTYTNLSLGDGLYQYAPVGLVSKLLVPYFTNESCQEVAGWLFLGTAPQTAQFQAKFSWTPSPSGQAYEYQEKIEITASPITLYANHELQITEFYTPLEMTNHTAAGTEFTYGSHHWYTDSFQVTDSLPTSTYWFYMELADSALDYIPNEEAFLHITVDGDHFPTAKPAVVSLRCYSDSTRQTPTGWLVFGTRRLDQLTALNITIERPDSTVIMEPMAYYPAHYMRKDEAQLVTTQHLIELIMDNQGIYESLTYPFDSLQGNVIASEEYYPAIAELLSRDDAVETLMNYFIDRTLDNAFIPSALLSHPKLQKKMYPSQRANYIIGNYFSSMSPFDYTQELESGKEYTTDELLDLLVTDSSPANWLKQCQGGGDQRNVLYRILDRSQILQQLIIQGDVALTHIAARLSEEDSIYLRALMDHWDKLVAYMAPIPEIDPAAETTP